MARYLRAATGERFQYMAHNGNDTTVRFVLRYPGLLDETCVRAAMKALVLSVDVLRSSIVEGMHAIRWKITEPIQEQDYFHCIKVSGDPFEEACIRSTIAVRPEDPCQIRCDLVLCDTESALVLCVSHLVVDGSDGRYLLLKLAEACRLIRDNGSAEALQVKNGSRMPETIYEGIKGEARRELYKIPYSSKATSSYPYPTEETGTKRMVYRVIPENIMDAARKKAKAIGATANDILLAAVYQVYADFPQVDRSSAISISAMQDARWISPGGQSEGLCNMAGTLMTAMENGVSDDYEQTLREISGQTNALKGDVAACLSGLALLHRIARWMPLWVQMRLAGKFYGQMPVGMTNMGNLNGEDLKINGLIPSGGLFGGPLKKKPGMQISVMSVDGKCALAVYGQYSDEDACHVEKTLEAVLHQVGQYAL